MYMMEHCLDGITLALEDIPLQQSHKAVIEAIPE